MEYPECRLKEGRERSLMNRHPWIFSGALEQVDSDVGPGRIVDVCRADGKFMARGYFNPNSQIRVRVLHGTLLLVYSQESGFTATGPEMRSAAPRKQLLTKQKRIVCQESIRGQENSLKNAGRLNRYGAQSFRRKGVRSRGFSAESGDGAFFRREYPCLTRPPRRLILDCRMHSVPEK